MKAFFDSLLFVLVAAAIVGFCLFFPIIGITLVVLYFAFFHNHFFKDEKKPHHQRC